MSAIETQIKVPLYDAVKEYEALAPELMTAAERVLSSGRYILGPEVKELEAEVAGYLGVQNAIGVGSGTDALWLALKAADVGPGDLVLTSPFTFFATISAILGVGAEPVFADVDRETLILDTNAVEKVLQGRSEIEARRGRAPAAIKAIIPVHLFGLAADMDSLMRVAGSFGLKVIEDNAQAFGARQDGKAAGAWGDLGCFSFFPTKNLGGFGDGGLVATSDPGLAERVQLLRAHGSDQKYHHQLVGSNCRLDALQAALLRVKLRNLDAATAARRGHADAYTAAFSDIDDVITPPVLPDRTHVFHQYVVRIRGNKRDALREELAASGIDTEVHYPVPAHLQEALRGAGYKEGDFPHAEAASSEVLSLPIFPSLPEEARTHVIRSFTEALQR